MAVAGGIILFFALVGGPLLAFLGISLDAFRIAGGIMLFLIALEMVFEMGPVTDSAEFRKASSLLMPLRT